MGGGGRELPHSSYPLAQVPGKAGAAAPLQYPFDIRWILRMANYPLAKGVVSGKAAAPKATRTKADEETEVVSFFASYTSLTCSPGGRPG